MQGSSRFNDHLNMLRVNKARFMLQSDRMSVREIAANSGDGDAARSAA